MTGQYQFSLNKPGPGWVLVCKIKSAPHWSNNLWHLPDKRKGKKAA